MPEIWCDRLHEKLIADLEAMYHSPGMSEDDQTYVREEFQEWLPDRREGTRLPWEHLANHVKACILEGKISGNMYETDGEAADGFKIDYQSIVIGTSLVRTRTGTPTRILIRLCPRSACPAWSTVCT